MLWAESAITGTAHPAKTDPILHVPPQRRAGPQRQCRFWVWGSSIHSQVPSPPPSRALGPQKLLTDTITSEGGQNLKRVKVLRKSISSSSPGNAPDCSVPHIHLSFIHRFTHFFKRCYFVLKAPGPREDLEEMTVLCILLNAHQPISTQILS